MNRYEFVGLNKNECKNLNFPHGKVFFRVEEIDAIGDYINPKKYKLWYFHDWIWQPVPKLNEHDNFIEDLVFYEKKTVYDFIVSYKNPDEFIKYLNMVYCYA
jgi:hypothetical protein